MVNSLSAIVQGNEKATPSKTEEVAFVIIISFQS